MDLLELRNELDGIDKQIVELYEKRMNVCGQVADVHSFLINFNNLLVNSNKLITQLK